MIYLRLQFLDPVRYSFSVSSFSLDTGHFLPVSEVVGQLNVTDEVLEVILLAMLDLIPYCVVFKEVLNGEIGQFHTVVKVDLFLSWVLPSTFGCHLLLSSGSTLLLANDLVSKLLENLLKLTQTVFILLSVTM